MEKKQYNSGHGILVLDRGHVVVGHYEFGNDDAFVTITGGSVIRRWGTTQGLGELAKGGPTGSTKLDPLNEIAHASRHAVIMILDTAPEVWS